MALNTAKNLKNLKREISLNELQFCVTSASLPPILLRPFGTYFKQDITCTIIPQSFSYFGCFTNVPSFLH